MLLARLLALSIAAVALPALAGGPLDPNSVRPIERAELAQSIRQDERIEGRLISGADLIDALRGARSTSPLRIHKSIILGPLDFDDLPTTPLARLRLAGGLKELLAEVLGQQGVRRVANPIEITDSTILSAVAAEPPAKSPAELHEIIDGPSDESVLAINASEVLFEGGFTLSNVLVAGTAGFKHAVFAEAASFERSEFLGSATFRGGAFAVTPTFKDGVFREIAFFPGQRFTQGADFFAAEFMDLTSFRGTKFKESANFTRAVFHKELNARGGQFGHTSFLNTRFAGPAVFQEAVFRGRTGLQDTVFEAPAYFRGAEFGDELHIQNLSLGSYGDFRDTRIARLDFDSSLQPSQVGGRLDFQRAQIGRFCVRDVTFRSAVNYADARLGLASEMDPEPLKGFCGRLASEGIVPVVLFDSVAFVDDVSFLRADIFGPSGFQQVRFDALADFTGAAFRGPSKPTDPGGAFLLSFTEFRDLKLRWDQLPRPGLWVSGKNQQPLSQVLAMLEAAFRDNRQLDDANAVYYHFKLAELRELEAKAAGRNLGDAAYWDWLLAKAVSIVWGGLCGYGTKFWWVLGWAMLANLFFTLVYAGFGHLDRKPAAPSAHEFAFRQRIFDFPKDFLAGKIARLPGTDNEAFRTFVNALRLSSVVLFKMGPRDTKISGSIGPLGLEYVVAAEWLLGYYLLAAMIYTLAETMPLINRLLTGVF